MSRFVSVVLSLLAAPALLVACGGDSGTTEPPPTPVSVTVTPGSATVNAGGSQLFTAAVANSTNSGVTWTASAGSIVPNGSNATWTAPGAGGSYTITATSVADAARSASATVTVASVGVTVAPSTGTVGAGDTLPLTASVSNAANGAVTWTVSAGTIVGTGNSVRWAAPVTGGSYTVTAASVLDPTRSASATVTVTPVTVAVTAATAALFRGESTSLSAAVTGTSDPAVRWTASCGTIAGDGVTVQYVAPTEPGLCTVSATSVRDPATKGDAPLTVRSAWRVAALDDTDDGTCTFQHCSLREALSAANAAPDRDSIIVASSGSAGIITLTQELPLVNTPVDIVGPGAASLAINAAATASTLRRVLFISGEFAASVRGVTLRGGRREGGAGLVIDNKANVTLHDVRVADNESNGAPGGGVLVLREGRGTFVDVEITGNRTTGAAAPGGGLAIEAGSLVSMVGGRIADNVAAASFGGGARLINSSLVLDGTTVANNSAPTAQGGPGIGGAIFTDGSTATLSIVDALIEGNSAGVSAGALGIRGGTVATITGTTIRANSAPVGGGLEIGSARATLIDTHVRENTAAARGAGVFVFGSGEFSHDGGSIRENVAGTSGGGGLYLQETATAALTDVNVDNNRANGEDAGGGIWAGNTTQLRLTGGSVSDNAAETFGGGIFLAGALTFELVNVDVERNRAEMGGGGLFIVGGANGAITGGRIADNVAVTGGGGGAYAENVSLVVEGTTFATNSATQNGGALLARVSGSYTLRDVIAEENTSSSGGAYAFNGDLTIIIEGGTIRRNRSVQLGGGLWKAGLTALTMTGTRVLDNEAGSQGGGIQLQGPGSAATLRRITVSGNRATGASGGGVTAGVTTLIEESTFAGNTAAAIGGGLFTGLSGNSTVRNSTFSANTALVGGGIAATGPATLTNVTLIANTASDYGGGMATNNAGAVTVTNVLLAGNFAGGNAGDCGSGGTSTIRSTGGNLAGDATCTSFTLATDKPNTAPDVNTTLADNGGRTFTHALLDGSAAINAGVAASCPVSDQRGFSRVAACDIGAFEFGATSPSPARAGAMMRRR